MVAEFVCGWLPIVPPMRAVALTTNTSILTASSNDYGFERVFARQVEALGRPAMCSWASRPRAIRPMCCGALEAAETRRCDDWPQRRLTGGKGGKMRAALRLLPLHSVRCDDVYPAGASGFGAHLLRDCGAGLFWQRCSEGTRRSCRARKLARYGSHCSGRWIGHSPCFAARRHSQGNGSGCRAAIYRNSSKATCSERAARASCFPSGICAE